MPSKERGVIWTESVEKKEFQGVYWNRWKTALYKHLEKEYGDCERKFVNKGIEPILHDWFVLRMKRKLATDENIDEKIRDFSESLDEEIFDEPEVREAFKFITERTEVLKKNLSIKYKKIG